MQLEREWWAARGQNCEVLWSNNVAYQSAFLEDKFEEHWKAELAEQAKKEEAEAIEAKKAEIAANMAEIKSLMKEERDRKAAETGSSADAHEETTAKAE